MTYDYKIIGNSTNDILQLINNQSELSKKIKLSKKPIVIIGESVLEMKSGEFIFNEIKEYLNKNNFINNEWNALNILIQNASTVGSLDLKLINSSKENNFEFFDTLENNEVSFLYLLGSDNLKINKNNEFIVYQGSHGDRGAEIADVILPSAAYTEQNGLYENLEGRVQECKKASYPIGESFEDWKIFNRILKKLGYTEDLTNFIQLRKEVLDTIPNFSKINQLPLFSETQNKNFKTNFISENILVRELDYYYTNSISRASKTMSECRQIHQKLEKDGTHN